VRAFHHCVRGTFLDPEELNAMTVAAGSCGITASLHRA
jgi:hypothetical protein